MALLYRIVLQICSRLCALILLAGSLHMPGVGVIRYEGRGGPRAVGVGLAALRRLERSQPCATHRTWRNQEGSSRKSSGKDVRFMTIMTNVQEGRGRRTRFRGGSNSFAEVTGDV